MDVEGRFRRAMAAGDFATLFELYERRSHIAGTGIWRPEIPFPEWDGTPGKRLVVWPEQGFGDKIMFARYIPLLEAADVTVLCEPALERLFARNLSARVVAAHGATRFPDPDAWVFYGSLPHHLGVASPNGAAYLQVPSPRRLPGVRAGYCTRGSPVHHNDLNRSLPVEIAQRLAALPGFRSLHVDDTGARDFFETAKIISGLDLVVTVDTAIAHLSGALGKPVWILLPATGLDWRWGLNGETTPWYDSARLFRQADGEPWNEVIDRVEAELRL